MATRSRTNRFVPVIAICTITSLLAQPMNQLQAFGENTECSLRDINFGIRIQKLIDAVKKSASEKNPHKLNELLWDIKNEIDGYTGKKSNIEAYINQFEKMAKQRGVSVSKSHMNTLRNKLKKQEKKKDHKALYMVSCLEYGVPYSHEQEELFFQDIEVKKDYPEDEVMLPLEMEVGITLCLVGVLLISLPVFPLCIAAGEFCMSMGSGIIGSYYLAHKEEK